MAGPGLTRVFSVAGVDAGKAKSGSCILCSDTLGGLGLW